MFRTMRRIVRIVRWVQWQPKPRQRQTQPVALQNAEPVRQSARSTADVLATIESLPLARVLRVLDGDTVIVSIGPAETTVRLDAIDCPENGQPWGDTARYGLTKLIGGRHVALEVHGRDPHGRTLATIYVRQAKNNEWMNVNERLVMLGHAWVMRMYCEHLPKDRQTKLNNLESWARSRKVGLWKTDSPTPPWQWRKQGKS